MRLTLRTLLAYLDDTLEPNQTKGIGEKVAESPLAQQLVERIKKVTRRRGISAPAVTGNDDDTTADPNTVAEYLDNVLPGEQLSEVEESALHSDTKLAEIAACHQILTLVLGEPARVPPTARQRMYRVVKGRESIPYRKPTGMLSVSGFAEPEAEMEDAHEGDDALMLGLADSKKLIPIVASGVLVVFLIVAIGMSLPSVPLSGHQGYVAVAANDASPPKIPIEVVAPDKKPKTKPDPVETIEPKQEKKPLPDPERKDLPELAPQPRVVVEVKPDPKPVEKNLPGKVAPPDPTRREIARLENRDTVVMQRPRDTERWKHITPDTEIMSGDTLVGLPGYHSDVRLESGVQLRLWGSLPEFAVSPVLDLLESRVTLHVPPQDFDADFTLESGRVFLTRPVPKGKTAKPAKIRFRFKSEVWDITLLDDNSEVCVDLQGSYPEGVPFSKDAGGESPLSEMYLGILKGKAGIRVGFKEFNELASPTRLDWDNKGTGVSSPAKVEPKALLWWSTEIPNIPQAKEAQKDLQNALGEFSKRLNAKGTIPEVIFASALRDESKTPGTKILAIHCMQAMDDIEGLASALGDDIFIIRAVAIRATQHWTAQASDRDLIFYKMLMEKKGYSETQARTIMQLLHPFSMRDARDPSTFATLFDFLKHEKAAIRELAHLRLSQLDREGAKEFGPLYLSANDDNRNGVIEKWKASWKRRWDKKS